MPSSSITKNFNRIDLNDIRLFVSVAQAGSLTKASELLNIPKSHLSRHLTDLEESLGTTLMDRGRRGVVLNELGLRFFHHAQEVLRLAQLAIDDVQHNLQQPSGLLRISVSTEVGRGFLMLHLPEYFAKFPEVNLEVQIDNRKINMIQDGIDIAFRVGSLGSENVVARKLFDIEFGLFASSDYIAKKGEVNTPHELYSHDLIYKYDGPEWIFYHKQQQVHVRAEHKLVCNDFNLAAQMVNDGVGIALLPLFDNLIWKSHQRILADWQIERVPLYLVYYKNRGATSTVRSMIDFLLDKCQ